MKKTVKRGLKIAAGIASAVLLGGILTFANALVGNPVSALLAKSTADRYVAEHYAEQGYTCSGVDFDFKFGGYYARVNGAGVDEYFSLKMDMLGHLQYDDFVIVSQGFNTSRRLYDDYRALCQPVLNVLPYETGLNLAELVIVTAPGEADEHGCVFDAPVCSELVVNGQYDVRELARGAGRLIIYVDSRTVSTEVLAQALLDTRRVFDGAGVPFAAVSMTLQTPKPADGSNWAREEICVLDFAYEDIYEEGLTARVQTAVDKAAAYYAALDAQGKEDFVP